MALAQRGKRQFGIQRLGSQPQGMTPTQKTPLGQKPTNPTGRGGALGLLASKLATGLGRRRKQKMAQKTQGQQGLSQQAMGQKRGAGGPQLGATPEEHARNLRKSQGRRFEG